MAFWKKSKPQAKASDPFVPQEVREDAPETITRERTYGHWLDQAFTDFANRGGFDDLPGKGKPLDIQTGDPLSGVLKNANVLPSWLELQHEIRDDMAKLISDIDNALADDIHQQIHLINKKISKYNNQVPSVVLQKMKITKDTLSDQYIRWM